MSSLIITQKHTQLFAILQELTERNLKAVVDRLDEPDSILEVGEYLKFLKEKQVPHGYVEENIVIYILSVGEVNRRTGLLKEHVCGTEQLSHYFRYTFVSHIEPDIIQQFLQSLESPASVDIASDRLYPPEHFIEGPENLFYVNNLSSTDIVTASTLHIPEQTASQLLIHYHDEIINESIEESNRLWDQIAEYHSDEWVESLLDYLSCLNTENTSMTLLEALGDDISFTLYQTTLDNIYLLCKSSKTANLILNLNLILDEEDIDEEEEDEVPEVELEPEFP